MMRTSSSRGYMAIDHVFARSSRGRRGKGWNVDIVVGIVRKGIEKQREWMSSYEQRPGQRSLDLNLTFATSEACVCRLTNSS
jgi:hypothetical protein